MIAGLASSLALGTATSKAKATPLLTEGMQFYHIHLFNNQTSHDLDISQAGQLVREAGLATDAKYKAPVDPYGSANIRTLTLKWTPGMDDGGVNFVDNYVHSLGEVHQGQADEAGERKLILGDSLVRNIPLREEVPNTFEEYQNLTKDTHDMNGMVGHSDYFLVLFNANREESRYAEPIRYFATAVPTIYNGQPVLQTMLETTNIYKEDRYTEEDQSLIDDTFLSVPLHSSAIYIWDDPKDSHNVFAMTIHFVKH